VPADLRAAAGDGRSAEQESLHAGPKVPRRLGQAAGGVRRAAAARRQPAALRADQEPLPLRRRRLAVRGGPGQERRVQGESAVGRD